MRNLSNRIIPMLKHLFSLLTLSALLVTAPAGRLLAGENEQQAQAAAEQWLALIDAGQFEQSWQTAASVFKAAVTQSQWKNSLDAVRKPLGTLVSRSVKSAKFTKSLPGAPDGEYVVIQFATSFSNKQQAIETVTPMRAGGQWKVSGYFIK